MNLTAVQRFVLALALIVIVAAAATGAAIMRPWMGLSLVQAPDGLEVVAVSEPAARAGVEAGDRLLALASPEHPQAIPFERDDLIEEPDALETFVNYNRFMERQGRFAAIMEADRVTVHVERSGNALALELTPAPRRPVDNLPFAFWFQIGCAMVISVIGAWVASLRKGDVNARLFAMAGYGAALSMFTAAIYSTRELALPGTFFHGLSAANHAGAMIFAIFMIGLFTRYPVHLGLDWLFAVAAATLSAWWLLTVLQLNPDISSAFYLGVLVAMITIIALIAAQYRATRNDLPSRRALMWLGVSVLIGAGAFTVLMALPILIRQEAALSQAYSFGFFPLIYLGVALGLTRYRLFDLDRWAFGVLTYILAVFLFVLIDVALVSMLAINFSLSLGITALVVGLIYLPLRNQITTRWLATRDPDPYELFRASAEIALQPTDEERAAQWRKTLGDHFRPLGIEPGPPETARPRPALEGLALDVPAYPWSGPLRLNHLAGGRRLFGAPHARIVEQLSYLVSEAERNRRAYDRGVIEERRRIGRDLHDNVGSMLLSSLRAPDSRRARAMVRGAIGDIREIVNGLSDRNEPLGNIIAQLRAETLERLSGTRVDWPVGPADEAAIALPYQVYRSFTSAHRELVANVLRHSDAGNVRIETELANGWLRHRMENDVAGEPGESGGGNGIANLTARAAELGGAFSFQRDERRARAEIRLPVAPGAGAAAP